MTPSPHTIDHDQPLPRAESMMKEYGIRHLPVLDGGKLVGILTAINVLRGLSTLVAEISRAAA